MSDEQGTPPRSPWGIWAMRSPIMENPVPLLLFLYEQDGEYRLLDAFASERDDREHRPQAYWESRGGDPADLKRKIEEGALIRVGDMPPPLLSYAGFG